jgi:hypothetical protein
MYPGWLNVSQLKSRHICTVETRQMSYSCQNSVLNLRTIRIRITSRQNPLSITGWKFIPRGITWDKYADDSPCCSGICCHASVLIPQNHSNIYSQERITGQKISESVDLWLRRATQRLSSCSQAVKIHSESGKIQIRITSRPPIINHRMKIHSTWDKIGLNKLNWLLLCIANNFSAEDALSIKE